MNEYDKLSAIAVDDEPMALEVVKSHAAYVPFLKLEKVFTDAFQAAGYLQKAQVDLIFLDIKMPDISGMEFLKALSNPPMAIFTTAYSEHAVQSFELDAVDYLLKPFSLHRFAKACEKARQWHLVRNPDISPSIFIKSGYEQIKLELSEILYVESAGNYMIFVTSTSRVLSRMSVQDALVLLPEKRFLRIHRSFIVAADKVEKVTNHQICIQGKEIPIGNHYRDNLLEIKDGN